MDSAGLIQQAKQLINANRRREARAILEEVVTVDEQNEQAWLWLSAAVETPEDQELCLENVLSINPANQKALKGLDALRQRRASAPPPPPAIPTRPPAPPKNFPAPDMGMGAASSSSVEWGGSGGKAAVGSGKNVPQPTSDEYDDWMANLPLDGKPAPSDSPAFGSDFDFESGPFSVGAGKPKGISPFEGEFDYDSLLSTSSTPAAPTSPTDFSSAGSGRATPFGSFSPHDFSIQDENLFAGESSSGDMFSTPTRPDAYDSGFGGNQGMGAAQAALAFDMGLPAEDAIGYANAYDDPNAGYDAYPAAENASFLDDANAFDPNTPLFDGLGGAAQTAFPSPETATPLPSAQKARAPQKVNFGDRKAFTGAGRAGATPAASAYPPNLFPPEIEAAVGLPSGGTMGNLRTLITALIGLNILSGLLLILNLIGVI